MDFIIDTVGDTDLSNKSELLREDEERTIFIDREKRTQAILDLFDRKKQELDTQVTAEEVIENKLKNLQINQKYDDFFNDMLWSHSLVAIQSKKQLFTFDQLDKETGKLMSNIGTVDVEKEMKNSVLKPGIEKELTLPQYNTSDKKLRKLRKEERKKTTGTEWFNMTAPEITPELATDLKLLKMRSVLDPKHFYKKNDMAVLPKYFQVGRIMDSSLDHVNERLTKKQRKRTMVDELLADAATQNYNKKKYKEIIDEKRKSQYKTFMKDKRMKNKAELKKNKSKKNK